MNGLIAYILSKKFTKGHFKGGTNITLTDNADGTVSINASGEVSSEDVYAREQIAAHIADDENPHSVTAEQIGAYVKNDDGIPYDDLSNSVQTSLGLADSALQSHQDISGKVDKTTTINSKPLSSNVTLSASDIGALPNTTTHLSGDISTSEKGESNGVATLDENGKVPSSQLPSYVDDVLEFANKDSFPTTGESGKIYVDKTTNLIWRWSGNDYVEISPSLALGETSSTAYAGNKGKQTTDDLNTHTSDSTVHITASERTTWNNKSDFSGDYDDLTNKPTIPTAVTESTVSGWGFTKNTGTYSKPSSGIPKSDLASDVQTSLDLANSALQSFTETDPTVPSHVKGITQQDINKWNASVKDYQDHAVGVEIDYDANTATRLGLAFGRTQGLMFNSLYPFGQMKRCNLADDGTVNAYYGESGYIEDGSNGQVMVEIPKFYYHVEPVKYSKITDGQGYHIKKARYWVSEEQLPNFKIHPAFIGEDRNICNKIYIAAYEGCLYDVSAGAYLAHDEQVLDATADLLSSIAGVKPASGLTQQLTRPNLESAAKRRGSGWHTNGIKSASLVQLLMLIELAGNFQTVLGNGIVSITDQSAYSCTSLTGSTSSLGNDSGMAEETINEINGVQTTYINNGRVSVSYRGIENPYGNIYDSVYGINVYGNGSQKGGIPYIAKDFDWVESKNNGNYESAGFTLTNTSGYIKYFGYGTEDFDWVLMPSEVWGESSGIIGDYVYVTANLDKFNIARVGSSWSNNIYSGGFCWSMIDGVGAHSRGLGGRLYYVES